MRACREKKQRCKVHFLKQYKIDNGASRARIVYLLLSFFLVIEVTFSYMKIVKL